MADSDTETNVTFNPALRACSEHARNLAGEEGRSSGHFLVEPLSGEGRRVPFLVILDAYVRGLLHGRGSNSSMIWLQRTLQQDPRAPSAPASPSGPRLLDLCRSWCRLRPCCWVASRGALLLWQLLHQIERQSCDAITGWEAFIVWSLHL